MRFRLSKQFMVALALVALAAVMVVPVSASGFERWPVITLPVPGEGDRDFFWAGAPDGPNGETDVPGHYWVQAGPRTLVAKHYNTGPFGAPSWWSSEAPDGELLYIAQVRIDTWTPAKAERYASRGYVHYHEFLDVETGEPHPTLVGWFKHTARTSFALDGGPAPQFAHEVTPGIDYEFILNWTVPYNP
jgi:selenium-binding protein 1